MDNDNMENICLISREPLDETKITLLCKHSFNYVNIFDEIIKQKTIINNKEVQKLKYYCIKCPYCRNIENSILPYYKMNDVTKIYGVNYPMKFSLVLNNCKEILKSGKRKGKMCGRICNDSVCHYHKKKR